MIKYGKELTIEEAIDVIKQLRPPYEAIEKGKFDVVFNTGLTGADITFLPVQMAHIANKYKDKDIDMAERAAKSALDWARMLFAPMIDKEEA